VSTYEALKALHVLAAVVWVGSGVSAQMYALRAQRRSRQDLFNFGDDAEWYANRFILPSALIVVLTGFGLVADADYSLGDFWLSFAIAGFAVSFVLGAVFVGPTIKKASKARAEGRNDEAEAMIGRVFLISRIELVLLIAIVVDMVVKPGT
jgi:uncharacterized membrane protein